MGARNKFTKASSDSFWFLNKNYVELTKSKRLKSKWLKSKDSKYVFVYRNITILWDRGLLSKLRKITQKLWNSKVKAWSMSVRKFRFFSIYTQSQLCTATPIPSFVQCPISFWLVLSSVATYILFFIYLRIHENGPHDTA